MEKLMPFEFWLTGALLVGMTVFLIREILPTDLVVFGTMILLLLFGVITPDEAFSGFSNHGMLTVMFLFIVAGALQQTAVLNRVGETLMGRNGSVSVRLLRFLPPVAAISAFFNNTPIVAMLTPVVSNWAKKHNQSVSKFLIPLSYATILGGTCTLIGTSTNLVVHGLLLERGLPGFSFFEISRVGIPVAIFGILFISLVTHRMLPDRQGPLVQLGEKTREFVVAMKVEKEYAHTGRSIEAAGMRHLKGLFLFQISREKTLLSPVGPKEVIREGDLLFFTGLPETILDFQKTPGLRLLRETGFDLKHYDSDTVGAFEAVVSPNSPLIGVSVRDSGFRTRYNAVIVAIHRSGERVKQKIGDIVLRSGDTLLILAPQNFVKKWYHSLDFNLVSRSSSVPSKPRWATWFSLGVLFCMILAMALKLVPIILAVSLAAVILIASGVISTRDARKHVDWKVLLVIASAFGLAKAMDNSGLAEYMARELIRMMGSLGPIGLLAGVYFLTSFYTEIITNNAAAALLVPIAFSTASQLSLDPRPFLIAVALAASASFATPIGYQTNLMVYGPGGYKFRDFLRVGIPMNLMVGAIAVLVLYIIYL